MNYFKAKWKSILTIQVLALGLVALAALFVFQNCGQFKPLAKAIVKDSSLTTASCQLNGISIDHETMVTDIGPLPAVPNLAKPTHV